MKKKSVKKNLPSRKPKTQTQYLSWRIIYFVSMFLLGVGISLVTPNQVISNRCANTISCIEDLSGNYDEDNKGVFMEKEVTGPAIAGSPYIAKVMQTTSSVLGETTSDYKRIFVDLSSQTLYAFEGNTKVMEFPVSTGKWWPTPTGDFRIWIKLRYTRMQGGSKVKGTYYNLPNVPYTMFFYNETYPKHIGYGIHGAYWHNNFGHPMSHGCVNMKEQDVAQLYAWAHPQSTKYVTHASIDNPGTLVTIYGETPKE